MFAFFKHFSHRWPQPQARTPVTPSHTHLIGPSLTIVRYQFSRKKLAAATEQPPAVMHCTVNQRH